VSKQEPEKQKKTIKPQKTKMSEQNAKARARNFDEVALGYSEKQALEEAERCLQCKKPTCIDGCPVEIDIPAFIQHISDKNFAAAIQKIKEKNCLPAVCGRVCPQEDQCEIRCVLAKKYEPVGIGRLERFAASWESAQGTTTIPDKRESTGKRIAIIGSGPAGLTVAGDLALLGHKVTIFEALHKAGGVLVYGIPEFRLPKKIVEEEIEYVRKLGVEIKTSKVIGKVLTVDDLLDSEGFDAVFIGTGAGFPVFMRIPGENLNGVYSANEFLTRANLMKAYLFPKYDTPIKKGKKVAVVGGGNVAMDSARTALRLGADQVYLVYRRSEKEMPARIEEVEHAKEEGIIFRLLTNPKRILGQDGWVTGMECCQMELGEPDESGRCRPITIDGSEFVLDVDVVIMAVGTKANPLIPQGTPNLELNKWGYIQANEETGLTSREGVYAGGDIVTGAATVILAMGAGRKAAHAVHSYLTGEELGVTTEESD
jgi:glutamate synthase (NADPH/NADH) small chain